MASLWAKRPARRTSAFWANVNLRLRVAPLGLSAKLKAAPPLVCIVAPSKLAFKLTVNATCDLTFTGFFAKFEDPWDLDANDIFALDGAEPFVTGYTAFGPAEDNQWYNWKEVTLGTVTGVEPGVHQFNMQVKGAFPNTDCFTIAAANYAA